MTPVEVAERVGAERIRSALRAEPFPLPHVPGRTRAAVALVLSGAPPKKIFFIVRARHKDDPWSGDIGFPGGKLEARETPRETAERETAEEVGIDIRVAELLGGLPPLRGAHLPVDVSCLVYRLAEEPVVRHNQEVAHSFWIEIAELLQPQRFGAYPVRFGSEPLVRPGIRILPPGEPVLWGLTYRLLQQFFTSLEIPFPPSTP